MNALQSLYCTILSVHPWFIGCWLTTNWAFGVFKSRLYFFKDEFLTNWLATRKCGSCHVFGVWLKAPAPHLLSVGEGRSITSASGIPCAGETNSWIQAAFGWAALAHWTVGLGLRNAGKTSKALPPFLPTLPRCVNTWGCQGEADSVLLQRSRFPQAFPKGEKQVSSETAVLC